MTIKAILTPYSAMPLSGGTFFVQPPDLPRNDKQALEMHVASTLISSLSTDQQANIQNLRPNTDDPPDVFIRNHILERLILGDSTRNRVVFLHTNDAHADKLKLKGCAEAVAALLNKELASHRERWFVLPLPAELQPSFRAITVETYDLRRRV